MLSTTIGGIAVDCRCKSAFHLSAILLLACCALALSASPSVSAAQAPQDSKHASAPTAPSAGKALIIIYRKGGFVGSASHDALSVNGILLATLLNGEYASTEVPPGTAVVSGLPKMYYGGIIQSTGAAVNETTRKENERARFEVEAPQRLDHRAGRRCLPDPKAGMLGPCHDVGPHHRSVPWWHRRRGEPARRLPPV